VGLLDFKNAHGGIRHRWILPFWTVSALFTAPYRGSTITLTCDVWLAVR